MLKGIRVLDFSHYIPGPYATMRLADLGAEVVKVEPLTGDLARTVGGVKEEVGVVFEANNRSKQSVSVNLKSDEGLAQVKSLIKQADVLVESFRPGVMTRLGIGYEQVKNINPNLVYCSLSGYGQSGKFAHLGSHDLNYMALSGMLSQLKDTSGAPVHPTLTFADFIGGLAASEAILAALVQRERTNEGAFLDAALADSVIGFMNTHELQAELTGKTAGLSLLDGSVVCYGLYKAKDDRYISLAALEPKFWQNFCDAAEREDWKEQQFSKANDENPAYQEIKQFFLSKTMDEWTEFGLEVDCCMAPVLEPGELTSSLYCTERMLIHRVNPQLLYIATRAGLNLADVEDPPKLGAHNEKWLSKEKSFNS
ncbi:CoA transferase [Bacillus tianshenii]|nr:CoA transferase [Bacillus tianshenii]